MRSTKDLIPGESAEERQQLRDQIYQAVAPQDGVEELLAERIFDTAWHVRRGQRARNAKASKIVNALIEGGADQEARRVDVLAAQLEERPDALRELRTFPLGVAYLWEQWSIIDENLSQGLPLLASTRRLCFSLIGKNGEQVLRDDPAATRWCLAFAGMMYGEEATLEDILALLGTDPPEWMQEAEFVISGRKRLLSAVPTKAKARERITGYVAEVMQELGGQWDYVNEIADRDIGLDAIVASLDTTPAGISLANAIDKSDKSCLAAIRRLQAGRTPDRPGPKRGPKKAESAAEALRDLVDPGQAEPAAVAADAQATVAAEVPTDDPAPAPPDDDRGGGATDGGRTRVRPGRAGGGKVRDRTHFRARPGRRRWRKSARSNPFSSPPRPTPVEEKRAIEPIFEPAPATPVEESCATEPIFESAPAAPVEEKRATEPIFESAPAAPVVEKREMNPNPSRAGRRAPARSTDVWESTAIVPILAGRHRFPTGRRASPDGGAPFPVQTPSRLLHPRAA